MNILIKRMRVNLNISQVAVAKAVGVRQSTISRIEKDCSAASYKLVFQIYFYLRQRSGCEAKYMSFLSDSIYRFIGFILDDHYTQLLLESDPKDLARKFKKFLISIIN